MKPIPDAIIEPERCLTDSIQAGEKCRYVCDKKQNMHAEGDELTMCMGNGLWLYPPPTCISMINVVVRIFSTIGLPFGVDPAKFAYYKIKHVVCDAKVHRFGQTSFMLCRTKF